MSGGWAYVQNGSRAHCFEPSEDGTKITSVCGRHTRRIDAGAWGFGKYPSPFFQEENEDCCAYCVGGLRRRERERQEEELKAQLERQKEEAYHGG